MVCGVRRRPSSCGKLVSAGTAVATGVRRLLWCGGFRHTTRLTDPPSCLPPHKYSVSCSYFSSYFFLLTFTSQLAVVRKVKHTADPLNTCCLENVLCDKDMLPPSPSGPGPDVSLSPSRWSGALQQHRPGDPSAELLTSTTLYSIG